MSGKLSELAALIHGSEPCGVMAKYVGGTWMVSIREEVAARPTDRPAVFDITTSAPVLDDAVTEAAKLLREARGEP